MRKNILFILVSILVILLSFTGFATEGENAEPIQSAEDLADPETQIIAASIDRHHSYIYPKFNRGLFVQFNPLVSGANFSLASYDIAIKGMDLCVGYDFHKYLSFQVNLGGEYFVYEDEIVDGYLMNYSGFLNVYFISNRVRPYLFAGPGAYVHFRWDDVSDKIYTNLLVTGGLGLDINLTFRNAISIKAFASYYHDFQRITGLNDGYVAAQFAILYKFTF